MRSAEKELMDGPLLDPKELFVNLNELVLINKFTGGYDAAFRQLIKMIPPGKTDVVVLDLGCGAGDWLNYLYLKSKTEDFRLELVGLDSEPAAVDFAKTRFPEAAKHIRWLLCDYRDFRDQLKSVDIITCNLFCHHLTDTQIVDLLKLMGSTARLGFLINDLERHPLAYYSILGLTQIFSRSRYTKNDAPLSVKRGFKKREWKGFIEKVFAERPDFEIDILNKWAFRHLVVGKFLHRDSQ